MAPQKRKNDAEHNHEEADITPKDSSKRLIVVLEDANLILIQVRLFIFEILFITEDEILNKNFDDDSETENYSLNESSDVSTDEECDSILTTVQMSSSNCFIGKNGYKWNKNHAIIGRTRSHNIITHLPGLKGPAKPKPNCSIDIFNLFFTAAIIKQISEFTNAKIEEFRQRISDLTKSTYSNFTSEIEIRAFLGKSKTPKSKELSLPTQIVLDISRPLWKSNRNITADNWFTSIELVDKLKEHGLTYLGTMRKNKPQIPPQFQPHPKRESGTSIFGFSGTKTLSLLCSQKKKISNPYIFDTS
ncbi:hypothetical protein LAZ67_9000275 [Cordylochernes scorpioides]|uniref:PiggyBac transposable element-derived protein domain-containing protein n=1 Tax=Cordylochernes scorpioides TaxID=51811 RepID=A0ABY6KSC5_9ARAC|nr:hypothetical protein LAZ67_9000275 [Cordylochernes scorpioides]